MAPQLRPFLIGHGVTLRFASLLTSRLRASPSSLSRYMLPISSAEECQQSVTEWENWQRLQTEWEQAVVICENALCRPEQLVQTSSSLFGTRRQTSASAGTVSLVLHSLELTRMIFSLSKLDFIWCLKKRRMFAERTPVLTPCQMRRVLVCALFCFLYSSFALSTLLSSSNLVAHQRQV